MAQADELIWQIIGHAHCSFRSQCVVAARAMRPSLAGSPASRRPPRPALPAPRRVGREKAFCRNEYNVSGLCNRSCCPLANSRYATVREHNGRCFLYTKTIERAHTPARLWERTPLSANYLEALGQVDGALEHWPAYLVHKNKQRLTKITQYLIRMRRLAKAMVRPELARFNKKEERLLARKEAKALVAADLERGIEAQLLTRLRAVSRGARRARRRASAAGGRRASLCSRSGRARTLRQRCSLPRCGAARRGTARVAAQPARRGHGHGRGRADGARRRMTSTFFRV